MYSFEPLLEITSFSLCSTAEIIIDLFLPNFINDSLVVTALKIPSKSSICDSNSGLFKFNIKHLEPLSYSSK